MNKDTLGFFYQSAKSPCAVEMNIGQMRKYYPNSPIALWEDLGEDSKYVAKRWNVDYRRLYRLPGGKQEYYKSRPTNGVAEGLQYLNRIFISCLTTLKDVEWIMHYEDDVWLNGIITEFPKSGWGGGFAGQWSDELLSHLQEKGIKTGRPTLHGACGGVVFKRQLFIDAYLNIQNIDWQLAADLDPMISDYSDVYISYLLSHNGGYWEEWNQWEQGGYEDYKFYKKPVIHNIKMWYYHPLENLNIVNSQDKVKFFLQHHS